jgi:transcription antitermination protein NusB
MTPATGTSPRQSRSATRLAAIQALYALEVSGSEIDRVLADFVERRWTSSDGLSVSSRPDESFLRALVEGVVARGPEIDVAIEGALTGGWTLSRLEILLRAILRAGAFELCAQPDVPTKVIINEYLEIAHAFFAGKEPSLVNAVLDRLAGRFRGELERGTGEKGCSDV